MRAHTICPTLAIASAMALPREPYAIHASPPNIHEWRTGTRLVLHRLLSGGVDGNERGDFAALNDLLRGATFSLPDANVTRDLPTNLLGAIEIYLTDLKCTDLAVDDISLKHDRVSPQRIDVSVGLGLDVTCHFGWTYAYDAGRVLGTLSGGGTGAMETADNRIDVSVSFGSPDFDRVGPTTVTLARGCGPTNPTINVVDLEFVGSVSAAVVNVFERAVRDIVEDEVKGKICEELDGLEDGLTGMLRDAAEFFGPFLNGTGGGSDPLAAEKALLAANAADGKREGMGLFNFSHSEGLVHEGLSLLIDQVNDILGGTVDDAEDQPNVFRRLTTEVTGQILGVNSLLRTYVLDDDGSFSTQLNQVIFQYQDMLTDTNITLTSIKVLGLDSVNHIEPLNIIGSHTIQSRIAWDELDFVVGLVLDMRSPSHPIDGTEGDARGVTEEMTIKAGFRDLDATISLLLAFDRGRFGDVRLGSLLRTDRILSCLLSCLRVAEATQLRVSVGDIVPPTLEGFVSDGLSRVVSQAVAAMFEMYEPVLLEAIPGIFDAAVRPLVNDMIRDYLADPSKVACSSFVDVTNDTTVVDLRDLLLYEEEAAEAGGYGTSPYGDLFSWLKGSIIDDLMLSSDADGSPKINDLILGPLTMSQSGSEGAFHMSGEVFSQTIDVDIGDLKGKVELGVTDISIENVDSLGYPLVFLDPVDAHSLNNVVTMGSGGRAVRLGAGLLIAIGDEEQTLRNEIRLGVEMSSAQLIAVVLAKIEKHSLVVFPMRDALNPWCWLAAIPAPDLNEFGVRAYSTDGSNGPTLTLKELEANIGEVRINLECVSCTSPGLRTFADTLSSPETVQDTTDTTNLVLDYLSGIFGGEFLQVQIDRMLHDAEAECPHHPLYGKETREYQPFQVEKYSDNSTVDFFIALGIVVAVAVTLVSLVTVLVRWIVRRRHRKWLETLAGDEIHRLYREQLYEQEQEKAVDMATKSMITSDVIPLWLRLFMPIVILGNVALFLSGHLSLGATVNIVFQLADQPLTFEGFFDFTILQSTIDLWKAGAKVLALLIMIFSVIWPYTKQLITLVLWCLPPSLVSSKRRGSTLLWLDILGKWSMMDIFVLIVVLVAFRISVTSPENLTFLPENFYSVDVLVVPLWGLYANMTAQLVSQGSSHAIIHYHRKIVADGLRRVGQGELSASTEEKAKHIEAAPPTTTRHLGRAQALARNIATNGPHIPAQAGPAASMMSDNSDASLPLGENVRPSPQERATLEACGIGVVVVDALPAQISSSQGPKQREQLRATTGLAALPVPTKPDASALTNGPISDPDIERCGDSASATSQCPNEQSASAPEAGSGSEEEGTRQPLRRYLFGRGDHKEGQNVSVRPGVDHILAAASFVVVCLVILGCSISSFQFEILGVVGLVMEAGQGFEPAVNHYSVFSIVGLLFDQARFIGTGAQYVGFGTLSIILILTSLVTPLLLVGLLLWLWFVPMTTYSMLHILIKIEIVKAWQYIEVYIISVLIATWQAGGLSAMMVNEYCGSLNKTFSALVYYGIIKHEDAQCFYASSKVEGGTFILIAAAVLLAVLSHFVTEAAAQKMHEEEMIARRMRLLNSEENLSFDASDMGSNEEKLSAIRKKITPVPVLFVDSYRWFLIYTLGNESVC